MLSDTNDRPLLSPSLKCSLYVFVCTKKIAQQRQQPIHEPQVAGPRLGFSPFGLRGMWRCWASSLRRILAPTPWSCPTTTSPCRSFRGGGDFVVQVFCNLSIIKMWVCHSWVGIILGVAVCWAVMLCLSVAGVWALRATGGRCFASRDDSKCFVFVGKFLERGS